MFCGSTVLPAWLSKAVQVQLTMTVRESYENDCLSKQVGSGKLFDVTHSDVVKCWKWHCFASLSHCQPIETLYLVYWNWHSVFKATYFRMFLLYPINICCCSSPVSSWSSLKFHCISSQLTLPYRLYILQQNLDIYKDFIDHLNALNIWIWEKWNIEHLNVQVYVTPRILCHVFLKPKPHVNSSR